MAEPSQRIIDLNCKYLYEKYLKLGEENLYKRYPAKTILPKCINLYKNPNWTFEGRDLIDKKYPSSPEKQIKSNILSFVTIGPNKHLLKFHVCSENGKKSKYLDIFTDQEKFTGFIQKPMREPCNNFWVQIKAKNPETTEISWNFSSSPNFQNLRKMI